MDDDYVKLYEAINDRITDLHKSYRTLNDNHQNLEIGFIKLETEVKTVVKIVTWFVSPALAFMIIVELLKLSGVLQ